MPTIFQLKEFIKSRCKPTSHMRKAELEAHAKRLGYKANTVTKSMLTMQKYEIHKKSQRRKYSQKIALKAKKKLIAPKKVKK